LAAKYFICRKSLVRRHDFVRAQRIQPSGNLRLPQESGLIGAVSPDLSIVRSVT
jgi:hypothetical protein